MTGYGLTHGGAQISPTLTWALGCDAAYLTAVLDPDGTLLDCGRLNRLLTGKTRLALELRDRDCGWARRCFGCRGDRGQGPSS